MLIDANKTIARRFFEDLWNQENLALADALIAPTALGHDPQNPSHGGYPESEKETVAMLHQAFPDVRATVEDQIAEGDKVVTRWTMRGTHRGEILGIAPTGRSVVTSGIHVHRIAAGKIVEIWALTDTLGLLQQLGAIPAPG